ncbi:MAG: CHAP domain-containing protein [Myxococcota bacterium]
MRTLASIVVSLALVTCFVAWRAMPADDGAATPDPEPPAHSQIAQLPPSDVDTTVRLHDASLRIAVAARTALDAPPRGFRRDCSGYVAGALQAAGVLDVAGVPEDARVIDFWTRAEAEGRTHHNPIPSIGDLVFFDNTHDRDGNGKMDDTRTHIAIVVDVEPDGTVVMAHKGSRYALIRMNLLHPTDRESPDGLEWNSWLRRSGDRGNPLGMYKTAELWTGFASLDPTAVVSAPR